MMNTINYAGHFEQTISRTIIESAINIVVSVICVFRFGIYGVLIGTITALLYRTADIIIYANKKLLNRSPIKTFSIYGLNLVLFGLTYFLFELINIKIDSYIGFIAYGSVFTSITVIVFFVINCVVFRKDFAGVVGLLKSKKRNKKQAGSNS